MRSLIVPLLATLLVLTTPVGTGQGVHQNELVHPIFPHMHLIGGQIVSDAQLAAVRASAHAPVPPRGGQALGAGAGADPAALGLAVGPTLPLVDLPLVWPSASAFDGSDVTALGVTAEPPEHPPPHAFA